MAARPQVSVQNTSEQVTLPAVLLAPIRPDVVNFVHNQMNKNKRQPYGIEERVGMKHSAESWGTGRAVARIPRVSGGGSSSAGQGAFGNMCRGGRMFSRHVIWRKWHRKINQNQRRFAVASALAASAVPSLVMARGHLINNVPEIPLVLPNSVEAIQKTKQAIEVLQGCGAYDDVTKARDSRQIRRGSGKMRNRRHVQRRGPLVIYENDNGITQAFRNLAGVDLCQVSRLNLLQLAPGGHLGRFCIWTQNAFTALNGIFGSTTRESTQKKGYTLPFSMVSNSDITRIINSDEIQSKVRPAQKQVRSHPRQKKNPLTNLGVLAKLNPYALVARRSELLSQSRRAASKEQALEKARAAAAAHAPQQKLNWARLNATGKVAKPQVAGDADAEEDEVEYKEYTQQEAVYVTFSDDNCLGKKAPPMNNLNFVQGKLAGKKPVCLLFWAQYHKPGFTKLPMYSELAEKYGDKMDFVAVSIDPDVSSVKKYLDDPAGKYSKEFPLTFAAAHDTGKKLQDAYGPLLMGPVNIPHMFLIDNNNTIVWHQDHSQVGSLAPTWLDQVEFQINAVITGGKLQSNGPNQYPEEDDEEEEEEEDEEEE